MKIKKIIIHGCEGRGDGDQPYLTRWILFRIKRFAVYFHKFHRSDADDLHNHPWSFITIILWRGYYEQTFDTEYPGYCKLRRIRPGSILFRKSDHAHRVILVQNKPAYTLVIRFRDNYHWGFFHNGRFIHFIHYFKKFGC